MCLRVLGDQCRGASRFALTCPPLLLRFASAVLLLGLAASACGQTAASLAAESDNRFRGVSLSNAKPDLRLSLAYDHASGWYAGASVTTVEFDSQRRHAALFGYVGYARRAQSDLAWEIGATAARFGATARYDYGEVFVGLIAQRWNARAYFSPSYFGSGTRTAYAELNCGLPLNRQLRLFGHLGALAELGGTSADDSRRVRVDARIGIAAVIDPFELQLAWVAGGRSGIYPIPYGPPRDAWVLSAVAYF